MDPSTIICALTIETLNQQLSVTKTSKWKSATLQLIRNEFREIYLLTQLPGATHKFRLENISVHKKFMLEGKASIKFHNNKTVLYLSNAPALHLVEFLKTIFIKMSSSKCSPKVSLREQLVSAKGHVLQEISPVNTKDVNRIPSDIGKRKLEKEIKKSHGAAAKKQCTSLLSSEKLTEEQNNILNAVLKGGNIFFTGSAGTGKSFLLRKIISVLPPDVTVATASTGAAAFLVSGTTLHSFAGIGSGEATAERSIELARRPQVLQNWKKCKHLIIDEISMIDGKYFEKVEYVARVVRGNEKPFGGIQLILCGDFLQLPPVKKLAKAKFCFQTITWDNCQFQVFQLKKVHRQSDPTFIDMLNMIRIGKATPEITERLLSTSKNCLDQDGIIATRLCCYTQEANIINTSKLQQLESASKTYQAEDSDSTATKVLDDLTPVESSLILKVGAQVMLLKNINISKGLVNGARGVITKFSKEGDPVVQFKSKLECPVRRDKWVVKTAGGNLYSRRQIPLRLAWAFSIHKSQGLTLDCVEMSLSRVFEAGQAYVALSRAKDLSSLRIIDFDPVHVWANPDVLNFYKKQQRLMQATEIIPLGKKVSTNT